ncbi:hypothetical protein ZWY2020_034162 [Hordeum vulgare]|nr:hypothetical protein ZWY2020_034162 [Hordeum vulgare]
MPVSADLATSPNPGVASALPFCSAAPTPCSPLCPVTAAGARALRRVDASALRSFAADPLVAQVVPDRPLFSDSAILSPYATAPDDIVRVRPPSCPTLSRGRPGRCLPPPTGMKLVGVVIDDAAQHALMDAEMPITFPTDTTGVEKFVARFIDNLNK